MASVVRHRFRVEEDFYTQAHPGPEDVLLLVEVSLSTEAWDREKKLPLYARAGLPEVWRLTRNRCRTTEAIIVHFPLGLSGATI